MDSIFVELIKQAPIAAAFIVMVWLFLRAEEKREGRRVANAKASEQERRNHENKMLEERLQHEREINNMWTNFMKNLIDEQKKNFEDVVLKIHEHEIQSRKRYERMKITQKLKAAARGNAIGTER